MSTWGHGYNTEQGYTYNSFKEMSPEWLDFVALLKGYDTPDRSHGFRYLELGSGQGFGLCLMAACYPDAEFVGIDFNPEHIVHSRWFAAQTGLRNVRFIEGDFALLAQDWPKDLGQFHYVALHGILSWIPTAVRTALVQCLDHATLPGALVYASYNAMPGWAGSIPLQHLTRRLQVSSNTVGAKAIQQAQTLLERMQTAGAAIFKSYPGLGTRLQVNKTQDPAYLVHEYLHDEWNPLWFSRVAKEFGEAKLGFIGSATLSENFMLGLLPAGIREILADISDPVMQQEIHDCSINQSFRRDVFCRGARSRFNSGEALARITVAQTKPFTDQPAKIKTGFGDVSIGGPLQALLTRELASQPATLHQIRAAPELKAMTGGTFIQAIALLIQGQYLVPIQSSPSASVPAFNAAVLRLILEGGAPYVYLAAGSLGSGVNLNWIEMVLLGAHLSRPDADSAERVEHLRKTMTGKGRSYLDGEKRITAGDEFDRRLKESVEQFLGKLPEWRQLGLIG